MNSYERFALNEYLSEFPERLNFQEIINVLRRDEELEGLCINYIFEDMQSSDVAELIENTKCQAELIFNPKDINE